MNRRCLIYAFMAFWAHFCRSLPTSAREARPRARLRRLVVATRRCPRLREAQGGAGDKAARSAASQPWQKTRFPLQFASLRLQIPLQSLARFRQPAAAHALGGYAAGVLEKQAWLQASALRAADVRSSAMLCMALPCLPPGASALRLRQAYRTSRLPLRGIHRRPAKAHSAFAGYTRFRAALRPHRVCFATRPPRPPAAFIFSAFVFIDFAVYFLYGNEQQL
ncbi:MAG: hypothetical protein Pg6A_08050 [Termitinemataceae bacterium]|nr:MAG: hypothetical protein Pg6A_08050 [Termitinemataceae bacterium]